jgi:sugar phosphate isomerase/epimerase
MMKLGLVSAILPDDSFEQVIDYAASVGFTCVEVCCWPKGKAVRRYAGITHIDLNESDDKKLLYYRDYAESKGVKISSLGYYPNPLDPDEEAAKVATDHLLRLIDASALMGVNMVTTFIGNLDKYERVWKPIVAYAEKKGVKIGIENCPMLYTANEWPGGNNLASTPVIWREMFKRVPSDSLGLNYDPSHPYLIGADYVKPLYEFKDKIFHVHFKDIQIHRDKVDDYGMFSYPALWHSPKLPGLGGVDFGAFVSALNDIRYDGYACIEVEDKAFEASPADVKRGIEQSYRFMKQYM